MTSEEEKAKLLLKQKKYENEIFSILKPDSRKNFIQIEELNKCLDKILNLPFSDNGSTWPNWSGYRAVAEKVALHTLFFESSLSYNHFLSSHLGLYKTPKKHPDYYELNFYESFNAIHRNDGKSVPLEHLILCREVGYTLKEVLEGSHDFDTLKQNYLKYHTEEEYKKLITRECINKIIKTDEPCARIFLEPLKKIYGDDVGQVLTKEVLSNDKISNDKKKYILASFYGKTHSFFPAKLDSEGKRVAEFLVNNQAIINKNPEFYLKKETIDLLAAFAQLGTKDIPKIDTTDITYEQFKKKLFVNLIKERLPVKVHPLNEERVINMFDRLTKIINKNKILINKEMDCNTGDILKLRRSYMNYSTMPQKGHKTLSDFFGKDEANNITKEFTIKDVESTVQRNLRETPAEHIKLNDRKLTNMSHGIVNAMCRVYPSPNEQDPAVRKKQEQELRNEVGKIVRKCAAEEGLKMSFSQGVIHACEKLIDRYFSKNNAKNRSREIMEANPEIAQSIKQYISDSAKQNRVSIKSRKNNQDIFR